MSDKKSAAAVRLPVFLAVGIAASLYVGPAQANGWLESRPWQFDTSADKANKAAVTDLIERKKGGYYDSWKTKVYNTNNTTNNTVIESQVNCSVTSTAVGNTGSNGMDASASSPNISNSANTSSSTNANTASNGINATSPSGIVIDNNQADPSNNISNSQSNSGSLGSSVNDSATGAASGPVSANGGTTNQVLNSAQTNTGNQAASIADSTACKLVSTGGPLN